MSFSTVSRSSVLKSQDSTTWDGASNGGLVPLQAPRPRGSIKNWRSRPSSGTETIRKHRKPEVSSRFRHRDCTGSFENWWSRPTPGTETTRKHQKPVVSSHSRHRDHAEASKTGGLVPLQAPRPQGSTENRRSRPASGTETTRKPRKAKVSSRFRHRDRREAPKTGGLVPLQAPRPHGSTENRRSRPA